MISTLNFLPCFFMHSLLLDDVDEIRAGTKKDAGAGGLPPHFSVGIDYGRVILLTSPPIDSMVSYKTWMTYLPL